MKLKVYVVRYKEDITPFVESYYSDPTVDHTSTSLTIINNYGYIDSTDKYIVLNNVIRPDFSTGHLSRNWNQAIINGFKDLNNPDCDVVVCIQIDAMFTTNWYSAVKKIFENKELDYFSLGRGDEFQYFTPLSVKTIGLYDERYCNIGYQEADYFLRAVIHSKRSTSEGGMLKISINDNEDHFRVYNPIENNIIEKSQFKLTESLYKSSLFHGVSNRVFYFKWGKFVSDTEKWFLKQNLPSDNVPVKKEFKYYPYFEKDINSDIYILE